MTSALGSITVDRRTIHLGLRGWFLKSEQSNTSPLIDSWFVTMSIRESTCDRKSLPKITA